MKNISDKKFTILGAGRSGIGIAKLLRKNNAQVLLSDSSPKEKLVYLDEKVLNEYSIEYEFGANSEKVFDSDIIIVSPGISPDSKIIKEAIDRKISILSEIEVASYFCNVPIIAITGTNGKTTTTELTGAILKEAGYDVHVCGNVGLAFSEIIPLLKDNSMVVLEVSSFQLEYINLFRPNVSMLLNVTSDHIDWHGSFDNYFNAKLKINKNQKDEDLVIINYDDELLRKIISDLNCNVSAFSKEKITDNNIKTQSFLKDESIYYYQSKEEKIIEKNEIQIKGTHNLMNSMAAVLAVKKFDVSSEIIKKAIKEFSGVEHRIEFVKELNGVKYYNDSKATNYDSLYVALESFEKNIVLIMGGKKGADLFQMVEQLVKERVKCIYAIGQSKDVIYDYFNSVIPVLKFESFAEAVQYSKINSNKGDVVLFSPGYKSFDMFNNFEHRGEVFKELVNNLE